ncbi:hypothetical protein E0Z10_g9757 [Xylaria hypoxylon]|uniref:EKC/KEOPS complex subunit BUD32 n=1 Tax=Xylaria hypoxylon TaxID=37992 RepID=A0A4Z0YR04_9PEZI|nr:hypothetical protein E0Z10_g9757 [Xylaria hypoxylon]
MDRVYGMFFGGRYGASSQQQQQQQPYCFTIDEINGRLQSLCSPVTGSRSQGRRISEKGVREIQTLLRLLDDRRNRCDDNQWAWRPRLYAILHNIQAIEYMDDFIREHITDFNLPFNEQTLPQFIGEKEGANLRIAFFAIQDYYLTDVKDIESEKSLHLTLPVSGDTYFISQRPLGQGSFGGVDLVFSRLSTDSFARKRVLRSRGSEQPQKYLIQELRELRRLSHQHLVQIVGSYTDTEYIAYLMKPVASSTLEQFLNTPQPLRSDENDLLRPFYGCLAGAMNYLYTHRIRHRDLTARNILIDSSCKVYISDFGSSYSWESKPSSKTKHRNVPTSPDYMAPEVAKEGERGTKSDMWSLGIVFLEMTTKLLGHRPVSFRNKIRHNADKEKVQPYPYANMTVVINWMKTLGTTNTDYEHDKEPLGWIRELLHSEHEHRLTPPQLMQYVFESPSLHAFCCLKCMDDFQNEAFTYGLTGPRTDAREDSQRTRQEVEEVFSINPLKMQPDAIPHKETASIERWIENSYQLETPAVELPTAVYPESPRDFDDTQDFDSMRADQFLYNTYEHEFYNPTHFIDYSKNRSPNIESFPSYYSMEPVELPGDTAWPEDNRSDSQAKPKVEKRRKSLQDSGLGFLEYVSNSTDDDNKLELPFEEWSDRSSSQSEECLPISNGTLNAMFYEDEAHRERQRKLQELGESSELRFDEEEDKSDTEDPWDEASDRSQPSDSSQANIQNAMDVRQLGTGSMDNLNADDAEMLVGAQPNPANSTPPSSSVTTGSLILNNETTKIETGDVFAALPGDDQATLPIIEEQTGKADDMHELPSPSMPSDLSLGQNFSLSSNLNEMNKKKRVSGKKKPAVSSHTKTKSQKKARIAEKVEDIEEKQPKRDDHIPSPAIPDIVIDNVGNSQPEEPRLSKSNLRSMNKNIRLPIVPRRRDALMPIDTRKLMDNTWEMASSAPTSVISEDNKSKIIKFLFSMPNNTEIEYLLSLYCQKGSVSAVKTVLQKVLFKNKSRYFRPLIYAVRGASSRHNKCVRELLAAGADPDQQTRRTGHTPLHIAVQHSNFKGYTNLIWLLLSNNANPNIRDRSDEFPLAKLFVGADTGPLEPHKRYALIMLLKEGASPNFEMSGTGSTPLHLAVRRQDKIGVAMLLHMGAQIDAKTTGGTTPLVMTANQFRGELSADHAEVLDHLLQYGANVDERAGVQGRTALHWAAIAGCAQAVTRLLEAGANAHLQDKDGCDAMWLAVKSARKLTENHDQGKLADHVEIMLGLENATRCGLKLEEGKCAIETACKSEDGGMLRQLLKMGLDPHLKFREATILDFAIQQGSPVAQQILYRVNRLA